MPIENCKRICLWSGPRNISTALMYSFAQRPDTLVFDEPLYGHYLKNTDAKTYHPGADEVLASMETNGEKVIQMMMGNHPKEVVFFKNMGHHLLNLDPAFMRTVCNVILTRDPAEVIPSFAKEIENPSMLDIGFEAQVYLLNLLQEMGAEVFVIDSNTILRNPENELEKLCSNIGIPFFKDMLSWKPGPRPEDGVWAKHWYKNVHASSGFQPYKEKENILDDAFQALYQKALPFYKQLIEFSQ
ncbi:MAG: sulfotransferase family protein [Bacteroidetes bacterium]|nr:sulfotransferase family protein [Bacteroidota bacterium]